MVTISDDPIIRYLILSLGWFIRALVVLTNLMRRRQNAIRRMIRMMCGTGREESSSAATKSSTIRKTGSPPIRKQIKERSYLILCGGIRKNDCCLILVLLERQG